MKFFADANFTFGPVFDVAFSTLSSGIGARIAIN
jgi:hypothetical protein